MRRVLFLLAFISVLSGCNTVSNDMDQAMEFRAALTAAEVHFDANITADYGSVTYIFAMNCQCDAQGNLNFTVLSPDSIAGISGTIGATGGKLTFDDRVLAFGLLADGQLSPVSAPWILIKALRGGYLTSCTKEGEVYRIAIDDSYEADALHVDVWLGAENVPEKAEIYWQCRRLLTITVENFVMA